MSSENTTNTEKKISFYLNTYASSHQNKTNIIIHKICVPLIVFSIIGFLWIIPVPLIMSERFLNFAHLAALATLAFYLSLSLTYFLAMIPVFGLMMWITQEMAQNHLPVFLISLVIFIVSWIFQFVGHKIEGKKPSFFQDLLFLLIGPLWVAKSLFRLKE